MTVIATSWSTRIERADTLAAQGDGGTAAALLGFYARLLRAQREVHDTLMSGRPTGEIEKDLGLVLDSARPLLKSVADAGPDQLAGKARDLLTGAADLRGELLEYWHARSDRQFFAKAVLQPYAEWLAALRPGMIAGSPVARADRCGRCGGAPQLVIMASGQAEGGSRSLQCATCLGTWPFRRVCCSSCGNEDEHRLGYFQSPTFPHVRVDACEACRRYLKAIDLGRNGLAVPLIDEVASASLDVWATDRGYVKIELNLIGL